MRAEGWCRDPYGIHGDRWYSDGEPTSLVRDGGIESRDAPPPGDPPAAPVPLNLTPSDASDMMRADEAWVSFFAEEPGGKPWWLATTSVRHGIRAAGLWFGLGAGSLIVAFFPPPDGFGLGIGALIVAFFPPDDSTRITAATSLVLGAWFAASAVVVRRRQRGTGEAAVPDQGRRAGTVS